MTKIIIGESDHEFVHFREEDLLALNLTENNLQDVANILASNVEAQVEREDGTVSIEPSNFNEDFIYTINGLQIHNTHVKTFREALDKDDKDTALKLADQYDWSHDQLCTELLAWLQTP